MTKTELQNLVIDYASSFGIDPQIALAQISQESGFNPNARGGSGERGLGQFMPGTWARFGSGSFDNAFDPDSNLQAWGQYMTFLLNLFGWDYEKALIGYNGGEGHLTNPGKYGPPSSRARSYAKTVLAAAGRQNVANYSPDYSLDPIIPDNPDDETSILGLSLTTVLLIAGGLLAVLALRK